MADIPSDEVVFGAVQALCEFSLLAREQNHSNPSLPALDNVLKRFYKTKVAFREQQMSKSAKANVDHLLARESYELQEQKIHKLHAVIEIQLYEADKVTTSKQKQFLVRLNRAQHVATISSAVDLQRAVEQLEPDIQQVPQDQHYCFNGLFEQNLRKLLQEVRTKATGSRNTFAKILAQIKTAVQEKVYRVVNMTADKCVQFQVCPSITP